MQNQASTKCHHYQMGKLVDRYPTTYYLENYATLKPFIESLKSDSIAYSKVKEIFQTQELNGQLLAVSKFAPLPDIIKIFTMVVIQLNHNYNF